jgi:hypothetical protein
MTDFVRYAVLGRAHASSTGAADPKTLTPPAGTDAFLISVSAASLMTLDGTTPAANVGLLLNVGMLPNPVPVLEGAVKVCGSAGASEIEVVWLG